MFQTSVVCEVLNAPGLPHCSLCSLNYSPCSLNGSRCSLSIPSLLPLNSLNYSLSIPSIAPCAFSLEGARPQTDNMDVCVRNLTIMLSTNYNVCTGRDLLLLQPDNYDFCSLKVYVLCVEYDLKHVDNNIISS